MKHVLNDHTNIQISKKLKYPKALQELYRLQPEFNGKLVYFFYKKTQYIEGLLVYDKKDKIFYVFDKKTNEKFRKGVKEINGITTGIAIKRTLSEINETIHYVSTAKICIGQKTKGFEQDTLIKIKNRNQKNALPVKVVHASQEVLAKKIQLQRKKIANKNQIIHTLRDKLQQKIEDNEEKMSEELNQVAQKISNEVMENKIDISSFNPIFQELIRIQSEKVNGVRYHPMFMRWAISIYSRAGRTAYEKILAVMVELDFFLMIHLKYKKVYFGVSEIIAILDI
ncbi:unnamed protein product [Rhizophagus irregularis]|nr:unnamed protein product [Rhizophagus irregularis]